MRVIPSFITAVLLIWGSMIPIPAQELDLKATLSPSEGITVGDLLTLTLTATYPKGWQVRFPSLGEKAGEFLVGDTRVTAPAAAGDLYHQQLVATLALYRTGKFEIPAFKAVFIDLQNQKVEKSSSALSVEILSVLKDKSPALKDLKPQAEIPESYLWLWIGLLVIVGAAVLAYFLSRRMRARQTSRVRTEPAIPLLPPHEEARKALEALLARKLIALGQIKQFYFELSEIVRRMVGRQYGIVTLESTTAEILLALRQVEHVPLSDRSIEEFLNICDLIKFAKYEPLPGQQEELLRCAKGYIEDVRQAYEAEKAKQKLQPQKHAEAENQAERI